MYYVPANHALVVSSLERSRSRSAEGRTLVPDAVVPALPFSLCTRQKPSEHILDSFEHIHIGADSHRTPGSGSSRVLIGEVRVGK